MAKKIMNLVNNIDFSKVPFYFGIDGGLNLQRYDKFRDESFLQFFKEQSHQFWWPEEFDLTKDRLDFQKLSDHEKFIFTTNLKYQILLDSIQSRGIPHLMEDLTNPEIEAFCTAWSYFETIHSFSYTHIIKNVYAKPSDVFDNILNDEQIIKRATSITKYYDDMINGLGESVEDRKRKLYLTLNSINILEGIRFYVSFACAYAFAENGKMEGNAKVIHFINKDENLHLGFTQRLIRTLNTDKSEGFTEIAEELEPTVIQMFKDAAEEEMAWADYLFKDGAMLGLNANILKQYMRFLTNSRMKALKLEPVFDKDDAKNPINWINRWTTSKDNQVAPQQSEIEAYRKGSTKSDLSDTDFDDYKF